MDNSGGFLASVIFVVFLVILWWMFIGRSRHEANQNRAQAKLNAEEATKFVAQIQQQGGLRPVQTNLLLKAGEIAYLAEEGQLFETVSVRNSNQIGVRVAKGVWLGSGTSTSRQEWSLLDDGEVTVTNKRIVFDGSKTNRSVDIAKIISAKPVFGGVEVSLEGRDKSMVLTTKNPFIFATVVHLCRSLEHPEILGKETLTYTFTVE